MKTGDFASSREPNSMINRRSSLRSAESASSVVTQRRSNRDGGNGSSSDDENQEGEDGSGVAANQPHPQPQSQEEGERQRSPTRQYGNDLWGLALARLQQLPFTNNQQPSPDESSQSSSQGQSIRVHSIPVSVPTFREDREGMMSPDDHGGGGYGLQSGDRSPPNSQRTNPEQRSNSAPSSGRHNQLSRSQQLSRSITSTSAVELPQRQRRVSLPPPSNGPRRRATFDDNASVASVVSNSILFNHDDPEDVWSDNNSNDSDEFEVMDLRPSSHSAVQNMETSSLVSFSSNISIDQSLASDLFHVANTRGGNNNTGHGDASGGGTSDRLQYSVGGYLPRGSGEIGDAIRGDLPSHWEAASMGWTTSTPSRRGGGSSGESVASSVGQSALDNPLRESERAYSALMSLMRGGEDDDNTEVTDFKRRGSICNSIASEGTGRSGFWTALGVPPGDSSTSGSEGSSKMSESSPLTRAKRRRRQVYARKCARAVVAFAAFVALSVSVIYFVAEEEEYDSMFEFLPEDNWLNSLFGSDVEEQEQETITDPDDRTLPLLSGSIEPDERRLPLSGYNYHALPRPTINDGSNAQREKIRARMQRDRAALIRRSMLTQDGRRAMMTQEGEYTQEHHDQAMALQDQAQDDESPRRMLRALPQGDESPRRRLDDHAQREKVRARMQRERTAQRRAMVTPQDGDYAQEQGQDQAMALQDQSASESPKDLRQQQQVDDIQQQQVGYTIGYNQGHNGNPMTEHQQQQDNVFFVHPDDLVEYKHTFAWFEIKALEEDERAQDEEQQQDEDFVVNHF